MKNATLGELGEFIRDFSIQNVLQKLRKLHHFLNEEKDLTLEDLRNMLQEDEI